MNDVVHIPLPELHALAVHVLTHQGLSGAHAQAMARTIVAGQRDDCQSHGVYRLVSCAHSVRSGKVELQAEPVVHPTRGAVVQVDARRAFSPLAFERGLPHLAQAARAQGLAALVIRQCFHFSALWPEVEAIAEQGLAALILTPSHAWVAPEGGSKPVFGTNPIAFGWPRTGRHPLVFDLATSAIARGDLELHRRAGTPLPAGCGVDEEGRESRDPLAVARGAMRTFGGHKGSALALMVELMAGALIDDWTSAESLAFDAGAGATPCHGELVLAFDPQRLGGNLPAQQARAEALFASITGQGARLPSARRYAARALSQERGAAVPRALYEDILRLAGPLPSAAP